MTNFIVQSDLDTINYNTYVKTKQVKYLHSRSRLGAIFYFVAILVASIPDNLLLKEQPFILTIMAIFLVLGYLRIFGKVQTDSIEIMDKWVRRHWMSIHLSALTWGVAFAYIFFNKTYPSAGLIVFICTFAMASACATQLSINRLSSQICSSLYFLPTVISIIIWHHEQFALGFGICVYMVYLLLTCVQHNKEFNTSINMEIALLKSQSELKEQSMRDTLTKLGNRRSYNFSMELLFATAKRNDSPLSLISIDLDHFKRINDEYGHSEGDRCLQYVAKLLQESATRQVDHIMRVGGEEFAILCPDTNEHQAKDLAKKIHTAFNSRSFKIGSKTIAVTGSIGVATLDASIDKTSDDLFKRADEQTYAAKDAGRNCIMPA